MQADLCYDFDIHYLLTPWNISAREGLKTQHLEKKCMGVGICGNAVYTKKNVDLN